MSRRSALTKLQTAACGLLLALAACGGPAASAPTVGPEAAGPQAAEQIIRDVRLNDPESLAALDEIRFTETGAAAAGSLLATHLTGDLLWAATYVYASSGRDAAPLRGVLVEADATVRVMAAAGLVARGDRAGFEPLIRALTDRDLLAGSEPPQEVWTFATTTLVRYAGRQGPVQSPNAGPDELAAAKRAWEQWLRANGDSLRFDSVRGVWSTT
ncbi:MAG TPA: hypothetical protein VJP05_00670 [Acidimicrobiia bacterium]|nr:hypothetical protein [Acidimicrobiia bacterium]